MTDTCTASKGTGYWL